MLYFLGCCLFISLRYSQQFAATLYKMSFPVNETKENRKVQFDILTEDSKNIFRQFLDSHCIMPDSKFHRIQRINIMDYLHNLSNLFFVSVWISGEGERDCSQRVQAGY